MARTPRPPHYLRQWRKHAGIPLDKVAERAEALLADRVLAEGEELSLGKIGLSHSTLSRIETFKLPYTQPLLELLSELYGAGDAASLIIRDPTDPEGIWSIYDQIEPTQRPVALRMLSGLKTGTDG